MKIKEAIKYYKEKMDFPFKYNEKNGFEYGDEGYIDPMVYGMTIAKELQVFLEIKANPSLKEQRRNK
jgi:hypothetical protein